MLSTRSVPHPMYKNSTAIIHLAIPFFTPDDLFFIHHADSWPGLLGGMMHHGEAGFQMSSTNGGSAQKQEQHLL